MTTSVIDINLQLEKVYELVALLEKLRGMTGGSGFDMSGVPSDRAVDATVKKVTAKRVDGAKRAANAEIAEDRRVYLMRMRQEERVATYRDKLAQQAATIALQRNAREQKQAGTLAYQGNIQRQQREHRQKMKDIAAAAKGQTSFSKAAQRAVDPFKQILASVRKVKSTITSVTREILKWTGLGGLFSGIAMGGDLFGMRSLARQATDERFTAQGSGVSIGELGAARSVYGSRLISNPESALSQLNEMKNSVEERRKFAMLGINSPDKTSTFSLLGEVMQKGLEKFRGFNKNKELASASGLTSLLPYDTWARLDKMGTAELAATRKLAEATAKQLELTDDTAKQFQELNSKLAATTTAIQHTFMDGLVKLTPELQSLSDSIAQVIREFMDTDTVRGWIDSVARELRKLAAWLATDEFKSKMTEWVDQIDDFAGTMLRVGDAIESAFSWMMPGKSISGKDYMRLRAWGKTSPEAKAGATALQNTLENPGDPHARDAWNGWWISQHPYMKPAMAKLGTIKGLEWLTREAQKGLGIQMDRLGLNRPGETTLPIKGSPSRSRSTGTPRALTPRGASALPPWDARWSGGGGVNYPPAPTVASHVATQGQSGAADSPLPGDYDPLVRSKRAQASPAHVARGRPFAPAQVHVTVENKTGNDTAVLANLAGAY